MSDIAKVLADNLRRLRKEKNLTQIELAEKVGVSLPSIQGYESTRTWPTTEIIGFIARAFKVEETELFRDPEYRTSVESTLIHFGRLIADADPLLIKHAIQILEIGRPAESLEKPVRRPKNASSSKG